MKLRYYAIKRYSLTGNSFLSDNNKKQLSATIRIIPILKSVRPLRCEKLGTKLSHLLKTTALAVAY